MRSAFKTAAGLLLVVSLVGTPPSSWASDVPTRASIAPSPPPGGIPLVSTLWTQREPYNDLCPMGDGGRTAAGCGVIAIAQIMRYHAWPPSGTGSASYVWNGDQSCGGNVGGGTLSADLTDPIDWGNMPNRCDGGCTAAQRSALAEFCYEAGVASRADYGNCGTSIYPGDLVAALTGQFRYQEEGIVGESRIWYTAEEWFALIRTEIDARRPVLYAIPGHAVVCDGWRIDAGRNQIHINWGDGGGDGTGWWTVDGLPGGHDPMSESLYRGIRPHCRLRADGTGDFATIQAAVDRLPGGGVIELEAGVYRGAGNRDIDPRGRQIEIRGVEGDSRACVIDCEGSPSDPHRGFYIHSGETQATLIRDLTIRGGYAQDGAAILCAQGSSPSLSGLIITGAIASRDGGGLFASGSSPIVSGCTFAACSAGDGGALFALGSDISLDHCTLFLNTATGSGGGAFSGAGAHITIDHSIIAFGGGGEAVVCADGGSASATCADVFGNTGGDWTGCLSGLAGVDGNISLDPLLCDPAGDDWSLSFASPCSAARNPSCGEIGAWSVGGCGAGSVVLVRPDGLGDFPTIQSAVDAAVDSVEILLGSGTFRGAGNRDVDLRGKRITIRSESDDPDACTIDCEGDNFTRRRAFKAITGEGPSTVIRGITIVNGLAPPGPNPGEKCGGAIYCLDSSPTIDRCIFRGNLTDRQQGGGNRGGAVACFDSDAMITDCLFEDNVAGFGGGLSITGGAPRIVGCRFASNLGQSAGAVGIDASAAPTFESSTFIENISNTDGGAVTVNEASIHLLNCEFLSNRAQWGAGICGEYGTITADGCTFAWNTANPQGGGIRARGSVTLRACTFFGNAGFGSGLYLIDAILDAERTIIASGTSYAVRTYGTYDIRMACCDLYGNLGGDWWGAINGLLGRDGNISADPLFCDAAGGVFRLDPGSPCGPFPPENPGCDRIGAWDTGCTSSADTRATEAARTEIRLLDRNPSCGAVRFGVATASRGGGAPIDLEILDSTGRRLRTVAGGRTDPREILWDGRDDRGARVPSGIYYCRIRAGDGESAIRIVMVR